MMRLALVFLVLLTASCSRSPEERRAAIRPAAPRPAAPSAAPVLENLDVTKLLKVELDKDGNGKLDRWEFYDDNRRLVKVGFSRQNDGVMDALASYALGGVLRRIEISSNRDGKYDRTEFYEGGVLTRTEDDSNGDGKVDKWETYRPVPSARGGEPAYTITSTAFDDKGTGKPNRRFIYGANGAITRVEFDPDGDGKFEPAK